MPSLVIKGRLCQATWQVPNMAPLVGFALHPTGGVGEVGQGPVLEVAGSWLSLQCREPSCERHGTQLGWCMISLCELCSHPTCKEGGCWTCADSTGPDPGLVVRMSRFGEKSSCALPSSPVHTMKIGLRADVVVQVCLGVCTRVHHTSGGRPNGVGSLFLQCILPWADSMCSELRRPLLLGDSSAPWP